MAAWADFAVAAAGASAALTGLLFVAVSLNLTQILAHDRLPGRAALTLALLVCLLVIALCLVTPGQTTTAVGLEVIGAAGVLGVAAVAWAGTQTWPRGEPALWRWTTLGVVLLPSVLFLVAGTSLAAGSGGGLYWVLAGTVAGFVGAVVNAWVLLVEINR